MGMSFLCYVFINLYIYYMLFLLLLVSLWSEMRQKIFPLFFFLLGRAYGNFGLSHESLGNNEEAVRYQEQHLSMAAQLQDKVAKTMAFSSLG